MSRTFYPQCRAVLQVVFDGFGDEAADTDPVVIPILPKEAHITRNSYRQADGWELVFEGNDLPIDPRLVRAGAVEIFMFQHSGLTDETRVPGRGQLLDVPPNLKASNAAGAIAAQKELQGSLKRFTYDLKPMIAGLFDQHAFEFSGSGKWVSISGQDYTDFLIKKQWPPLANGKARRIPTGKRLDILLAELLGEADQEERLELVVRGIEVGDLPTVGAKEVRSNRRGIPIKQETSYWDVMYKLATRHGCILYVEGLSVVLTRPANLKDESTSNIRRMAWGNNLESLELTREMGKETAPTVVIKTYDPKARKNITIDYPPGTFQKTKKTSRKPKKTGKKAPSSIKKTEEYVIIPSHGITDLKVLREMAKQRHTILGRSERKVRFQTNDLCDFNGDNILNLHSGDAYTVGWADFNSEVLGPLTEGQRFSHLVARGFNESVAQVIASSFTKLLFLERPLRVREASIDFTVDDGISIEAELVDFVMVDGIRDKNLKPSRKSKRKDKYLKRDGKSLGAG